MNDSDGIKAVLLDILRIGLLRIRALAWEGSADGCAVEANHLHNLPQLIKSPSSERLMYYYNIERTEFLRQTNSNTSEFNLSWLRLAKLIGIN